jgi:hypothetical protein
MLRMKKTFEELIAELIQQAEGSAVGGDPMQLAAVYWSAIQGLCCYIITGIPLSPSPEILSRIILKD